VVIRHMGIALTLLLCVCACTFPGRSPADRPEFSNLAVTLSELASEATGVSVENWLAGIMPSVAFSKTSSAETVPIA
jgi:hypothetical protein